MLLHVEFYELRLAPLHREDAEAHAPGTRENLVVAKGSVEIVAGSDRPVPLNEGDATLFDADRIPIATSDAKKQSFISW